MVNSNLVLDLLYICQIIKIDKVEKNNKENEDF